MITSDGTRVEGTFFLSEDPLSDGVTLKLNFGNTSIIRAASDYFEAMCEIRRELEKQSVVLECYGASKNVYPSGMSRSMGMAMKAYKMRIGEPARMSDLVDIFETGPDVEPATVDEQQRFFELWAAHFKTQRS
jgi:hypothetical protein